MLPPSPPGILLKTGQSFRNRAELLSLLHQNQSASQAATMIEAFKALLCYISAADAVHAFNLLLHCLCVRTSAT
eukprot:12420666-Karenia_brevis.AAC.1